jgi:hypothetical protein
MGSGADMDKDYLTLKRASASRPSGEWSDDDYDVLCEGAVVGRIFKSAAAPVGTPWFWTLAYSRLEDRTPTHGHADARGRDGGVRQELAAALPGGHYWWRLPEES